jgi:serine/threonine-protein kinase
MGTVYRGLDAQTGQTVAVKLLRPDVVEADPGMVERFAREGQVLRQLNHPNIVKVLDTADENGHHYIIMEYVPGGSLRDWLLGKTSANKRLKLLVHMAAQHS